MNNDILKIIYSECMNNSFDGEGISTFPNEEWQEETAALDKFAQCINLSDHDYIILENTVISKFMYKSGLEGFINGFKLAVRLFVGK